MSLEELLKEQFNNTIQITEENGYVKVRTIIGNILIYIIQEEGTIVGDINKEKWSIIGKEAIVDINNTLLGLKGIKLYVYLDDSVCKINTRNDKYVYLSSVSNLIYTIESIKKDNLYEKKLNNIMKKKPINITKEFVRASKRDNSCDSYDTKTYANDILEANKIVDSVTLAIITILFTLISILMLITNNHLLLMIFTLVTIIFGSCTIRHCSNRLSYIAFGFMCFLISMIVSYAVFGKLNFDVYRSMFWILFDNIKDYLNSLNL